MSIIDFKRIREKVTPDQVLAYFKYSVTSSNKVICPFHGESKPSMQLYESDVFCFGCKKYFDVPSLAKALLEKHGGREYTYREVLAWFDETKFPAKLSTVLSEYGGPVPLEFIDYWASQMTDDLYEQLSAERLITRATIEKYKIGWRPDWEAWTIPFWRGELGNSPVDIVQFRLTGSGPKYVGLKGHNRGSVQNAFLLEQPQPYLVVLFGAFDAVTALEDGIIAVGLNGSMPFRRDEKERVQELFAKQTNVLIVPDNTPAEYTSAQELSTWLNTYKVRYFPPELPPGCDYIDYRKLGYDAFDFRQNILCLGMDGELINNVGELLKVGDPYNLAKYHALTASRYAKNPGVVAHDISLAGPLNFNMTDWYRVVDLLEKVHTDDELFDTMEKVSELTNSFLGGW